jgi:hypothetical protein
MAENGAGFDVERRLLVRSAAVFGTLATQLQDSLPRWEEAAEAGSEAVGKPDAVAKYRSDEQEPLMRVVRAIDDSVNGFSRALSSVATTYQDADGVSADQFTSLATAPVSDG